jgi:hypothetical protein
MRSSRRRAAQYQLICCNSDRLGHLHEDLAERGGACGANCGLASAGGKDLVAVGCFFIGTSQTELECASEMGWLVGLAH